MRKITEIIIHCSATVEGRNYTVETIRKWHKAKGWQDIGYHYVIGLDGKIFKGRPEEQVGAHCIGHNANSIGICYIGGLNKDKKPKDTRTEAQKTAIRALCMDLKIKYPAASIHGHNEFSTKHCPCFNVQEELKNMEAKMLSSPKQTSNKE